MRSLRPRVAFQGEHGAFSEDAAIRLVGTDIDLVPCQTFSALFKTIEEGTADLIVAPVENTLIGTIEPVVGLLRDSSTETCGEMKLHIEQHLIGCPNAELEQIDSVQSHPAALAQCERFFAEHPHIRKIAADDTAGSVAQIIKAGDLKRGAIAGIRAAEIYRGRILMNNIHDDAENYTRFLLLRASPAFVTTGHVVQVRPNASPKH